MTEKQPPHSQTLSRGIRVLEILAESSGPMSITELADALGVHRSIAYRILRTLEDHGLVSRDAGGGVALGPRMAYLARNVASGIQFAARPELVAVANELGMTCFLTALDQHECITLLSIEPSSGPGAVVQRPGSRHSVSVGAPGIAIQSALSPTQWTALAAGETERAETAEARVRGYATSHDEVIPGVSSVAVPFVVEGQPPFAIGTVFVSSQINAATVAARLVLAAEHIHAILA